MSDKAIQYFGGVPTAPQVRLLMAEFKNAAPGDEIQLSRVADIIGENVRSNRFRVVSDAFRRALLRNNLVTERVSGTGTIRIIPDAERSQFGARGIGLAHRRMGRSVGVIVSTPVEKLTESERNTNFHLRRLGEALVSSTRAAIKEIAQVFAPPKQLPRRESNSLRRDG